MGRLTPIPVRGKWPGSGGRAALPGDIEGAALPGIYEEFNGGGFPAEGRRCPAESQKTAPGKMIPAANRLRRVPVRPVAGDMEHQTGDVNGAGYGRGITSKQ